MSFTDHKITQFTHRIVDLPDQPNLPADELKARFDSSPEELRQAHNALCDDADRLDDRVSGIIAETFGDTITEDMLSDELADKIDHIDTLVAHDHEIHYGFYTGDGVYPREIELGFQPKMVFIMRADGTIGSVGYACHFLAIPTEEPTANDYCLITSTGFQLTNDGNKRSSLNSINAKYIYIFLQ